MNIKEVKHALLIYQLQIYKTEIRKTFCLFFIIDYQLRASFISINTLKQNDME